MPQHGTTDALCSHALSIGGSALSTTTATGTYDGSSWQSFNGLSDNTFPDSSATLDPLGDPAGGSTFASFAGHSFFSMMGDTMPGAPTVDVAASLISAGPSQNSHTTISTAPIVRGLDTEAVALHASSAQAFSSSSCNNGSALCGRSKGNSAPSSRCVTPEPRAEDRDPKKLVVQPVTCGPSSGSSSMQAVPSPSALTVAEKIKRHEAAYVRVKQSVSVVGDGGGATGQPKHRSQGQGKTAPLMLGAQALLDSSLLQTGLISLAMCSTNQRNSL